MAITNIYNPVPDLENCGINNFHVDYKERAVYLESPEDLEKLADHKKTGLLIKLDNSRQVYYVEDWIFATRDLAKTAQSV